MSTTSTTTLAPSISVTTSGSSATVIVSNASQYFSFDWFLYLSTNLNTPLANVTTGLSTHTFNNLANNTYICKVILLGPLSELFLTSSSFTINVVTTSTTTVPPTTSTTTVPPTTSTTTVPPTTSTTTAPETTSTTTVPETTSTTTVPETTSTTTAPETTSTTTAPPTTSTTTAPETTSTTTAPPTTSTTTAPPTTSTTTAPETTSTTTAPATTSTTTVPATTSTTTVPPTTSTTTVPATTSTTTAPATTSTTTAPPANSILQVNLDVGTISATVVLGIGITCVSNYTWNLIDSNNNIVQTDITSSSVPTISYTGLPDINYSLNCYYHKDSSTYEQFNALCPLNGPFSFTSSLAAQFTIGSLTKTISGNNVNYTASGDFAHTVLSTEWIVLNNTNLNTVLSGPTFYNGTTFSSGNLPNGTYRTEVFITFVTFGYTILTDTFTVPQATTSTTTLATTSTTTVPIIIITTSPTTSTTTGSGTTSTTTLGTTSTTTQSFNGLLITKGTNNITADINPSAYLTAHNLSVISNYIWVLYNNTGNIFTYTSISNIYPAESISISNNNFNVSFNYTLYCYFVVSDGTYLLYRSNVFTYNTLTTMNITSFIANSTLTNVTLTPTISGSDATINVNIPDQSPNPNPSNFSYNYLLMNNIRPSHDAGTPTNSNSNSPIIFNGLSDNNYNFYIFALTDVGYILTDTSFIIGSGTTSSTTSTTTLLQTTSTTLPQTTSTTTLPLTSTTTLPPTTSTTTVPYSSIYPIEYQKFTAFRGNFINQSSAVSIYFDTNLNAHVVNLLADLYCITNYQTPDISGIKYINGNNFIISIDGYIESLFKSNTEIIITNLSVKAKYIKGIGNGAILQSGINAMLLNVTANAPMGDINQGGLLGMNSINSIIEDSKYIGKKLTKNSKPFAGPQSKNINVINSSYTLN